MRIPGDGAGIMIQMPDRFLRQVSGNKVSNCRRPVTTPPVWFFCPRTRCPQEDCRAAWRTLSAGGAARSGLARGTGAQLCAGSRCRVTRNRSSADFHRPHLEIHDQDHFERTLYLIRRQAEKAVARAAAPLKANFTSPASPAAPWFTRACCWPTSSALFRGLGRSRHGERHGHGPSALQHQHLSGLGPGPPVPFSGPQRRDQHPAGQPELAQSARGAPGFAPLRPGSGQAAAAGQAGCQ
jgi:hypothetical protein